MLFTERGFGIVKNCFHISPYISFVFPAGKMYIFLIYGNRIIKKSMVYREKDTSVPLRKIHFSVPVEVY